jgi:hypothetical protein
MSRRHGQSVERGLLGPMTPIGEGAVGEVYRLDTFTLPGSFTPLAFKELKASLSTRDRKEALRSMISAVAFRDSLSDADQAELDEYTTWPVAIVKDQGLAVGILMPLIPPEFFIAANPRGGQPSAIVCELAFLTASDAFASARGLDLSAANDPLVRLALAAQLVYAVARLHQNGIVYGDLSLRNAAVAINPPRVKLLDCDATALIIDTGRHQLHSPFFLPPENGPGGSHKLQDDKTDVYKLGLCVLRMLVRGKGTTQLKDPAYLQGILDQEGVDIISRALSNDRSQRPTAAAQFKSLMETVINRAQPPVMLSAGISRSVMLRGRDVTVSWKATGASRIRIHGSNGLEVNINDPYSTPGGYVVTPLGSGPIIVEAENTHGADGLVAGVVDLFDLPPFVLPTSLLPHPFVPALPETTLPKAHLPVPPTVTADKHPAPRLEVPSLAPVFEILRQPMTLSPASGRVAAATMEATTRLGMSLEVSNTSAGDRFRSELETATAAAAKRIQQQVEKFQVP